MNESRIIEPQNHRRGKVVRDYSALCGPASLLYIPEHLAEVGVQLVLEYL